MHFQKRFWRRLHLLCLVVGLMVFGGGLSLARPALAAPGGKNVSTTRVAQAPAVTGGAAMVFGIDDGGYLHNPTALTLASATGAHWVRTSVSWNALENQRGTYNFTSSDSVLNSLLAQNFSLVVYLGDNPAWAANTPCGPVDTSDPTLVASFANALGALAAHYPGVKVWAAYNEVDFDADVSLNTGGCFGSHTAGGVNKNGIRDSDEFAIELAAAWNAVHAANPNALFASGAMAFDNFNPQTAPADYPGHGSGGLFNYNFASQLFKYMGQHPLPANQKYMDLVLFNYYGIYGPYWEKYAKGRGIQAKTGVLRARMKSGGIPIAPLFVTETGEDSSPSWIGLNGQARCLDINLVRGVAAQLMGIIWWTFEDAPAKGWYYGLVDHSLSVKPSYTALKSLVAELDNFAYDKNLSNKTGFASVEAYRFLNGTRTKIAAWSSHINTATYNPDKPDCSWPRVAGVASFTANSVRVVNYLGKVKLVADNSKKDQNPTAGVIGIKVAGNPVIVELNP